MLTINSQQYCPDSTYFRTGSVEPDLSVDGDALTIYNGNGTRRSSWGAPGVTSTVVLNADDIASIHIGFHHKHGGGQFWRHYVSNGVTWQAATWAQLSDEQRQRVLDAANEHAPSWAKAPGKLRSEYKAPEVAARTAYKIVRLLDDGRMVSLYDGETEYVMGKRLAERAISDHRGGYYSYPSAAALKHEFLTGDLVPSRCYESGMPVALLEVEISGTILHYEGVHLDKLASTYLRPVRIVETFTYQPAQESIAC